MQPTAEHRLTAFLQLDPTTIDNTNQAVSVVQTASGALGEINSLLTQIRGLALNSANSGVNNSTALAADHQALLADRVQLQTDEINGLDARIATRQSDYNELSTDLDNIVTAADADTSLSSTQLAAVIQLASAPPPSQTDAGSRVRVTSLPVPPT